MLSNLSYLDWVVLLAVVIINMVTTAFYFRTNDLLQKMEELKKEVKKNGYKNIRE